MDSGLALRAPRNDEGEVVVPRFRRIEPIPLPSRPREPMAAREGDFVKNGSVRQQSCSPPVRLSPPMSRNVHLARTTVKNSCLRLS
jgi:hypothetical protein